MNLCDEFERGRGFFTALSCFGTAGGFGAVSGQDDLGRYAGCLFVVACRQCGFADCRPSL